MVVQISGATTGAKGPNKVSGIDAEDINLWNSTGNGSPDKLVSIADDIVEITSDTGRTVICLLFVR